jgi:tRNA(Ile)-lysidine synthase TilS/MesJ
MAVCLLAHGWAKRHECGLEAVTVDHAFRPESKDEARLVGTSYVFFFVIVEFSV